LSASDFEKRLCIEHKSSSLSAAEIINVVAKRFQISARLIKGPSRRKNVVLARSVAIYLMRKLTDFPLKDIGKSFANRDHSTVLHSIHKIESALSEDMTVKRLVDELQLTIQPLISEQNGIF
jgi:chromosomal replication initiator protein